MIILYSSVQQSKLTLSILHGRASFGKILHYFQTNTIPIDLCFPYSQLFVYKNDRTLNFQWYFGIFIFSILMTLFIFYNQRSLGKTCNITMEENLCIPNPCQNGICYQHSFSNDFACDCEDGYVGRLCDLQQECEYICASFVKFIKTKIFFLHISF